MAEALPPWLLHTLAALRGATLPSGWGLGIGRPAIASVLERAASKAADSAVFHPVQALLLEKFRHMSKQTLPVAEIQKGIATDTGMEVGAGELREALQSLERDGYVRFTRPNVISVA